MLGEGSEISRRRTRHRLCPWSPACDSGHQKHIHIRLLHPGLVEICGNKRIPKTMLCRILVFMWPLGPLVICRAVAEARMSLGAWALRRTAAVVILKKSDSVDITFDSELSRLLAHDRLLVDSKGTCASTTFDRTKSFAVTFLHMGSSKLHLHTQPSASG